MVSNLELRAVGREASTRLPKQAVLKRGSGLDVRDIPVVSKARTDNAFSYKQDVNSPYINAYTNRPNFGHGGYKKYDVSTPVAVFLALLGLGVGAGVTYKLVTRKK